MKPATHLLTAAASAALIAPSARGQIAPEWIVRVPAGTHLSAGVAAMTVSPAGVTFVTGTAGSSSTDILTTAIRPDGTTLWSHAYDGVANGLDQGRGIALAPGRAPVRLWERARPRLLRHGPVAEVRVQGCP